MRVAEHARLVVRLRRHVARPVGSVARLLRVAALQPGPAPGLVVPAPEPAGLAAVPVALAVQLAAVALLFACDDQLQPAPAVWPVLPLGKTAGYVVLQRRV